MDNNLKKSLITRIFALNILAFGISLLSMSGELAVLDPLKDNISMLKLVQTGGSDLSVVNAARTSYNSSSDKIKPEDIKLIDSLIKQGHKTPFEQTFLQYHVKAPIFVVRQWFRHRIGVSHNEQSARYTTMEQNFYTPKQFLTYESHQEDLKLENEVLRRDYQKNLGLISAVYERLLKAGVPRERARCILPVSLYTTFYFGCNLNSLFHFVELRANSHAQWETQQYAKGMIKLAQPYFPHSIELWCKHKNFKLAQELLNL